MSTLWILIQISVYFDLQKCLRLSTTFVGTQFSTPAPDFLIFFCCSFQVNPLAPRWGDTAHGEAGHTTRLHSQGENNNYLINNYNNNKIFYFPGDDRPPSRPLLCPQAAPRRFLPQCGQLFSLYTGILFIAANQIPISCTGTLLLKFLLETLTLRFKKKLYFNFFRLLLLLSL